MRRRIIKENDREGLAASLVFAIIGAGFFAYFKRAILLEFFNANIIGILSILVIFVILIYVLQKSSKNKIDRVLKQIDEKGLTQNMSDMIDRFGKEMKNYDWEYRSYYFEDFRLNDLRVALRNNGINITEKGLKSILISLIDDKELRFVSAGLNAHANNKFSELGKDGVEFEVLLVRLFNAMGYESKRIGGHGDQGGDVIAIKSGEQALVQAKFYSGSVGNAAVQQVQAALSYYACTKAYVVTTSTFTQEAKDLAKANNVELIDGQKLERLLLEYLKENWE